MTDRHHIRDVRTHYARLANSYDTRANRACKRAYARLVTRTLADAERVLELGAGSSPLMNVLDAKTKVACDLSVPMLSPIPGKFWRVAADGQHLPLEDATFDAVFSINVLEHVPDPAAMFRESARILGPGGLFLAVTPNGDVTWLLDLLERLHLKLPEGPHRFLRTAELAGLVGDAFTLVEHRSFLAFPAGPDRLVQAMDRLVSGRRGRGLFQYILLERK